VQDFCFTLKERDKNESKKEKRGLADFGPGKIPKPARNF
jgi:hypothetical protein